MSSHSLFSFKNISYLAAGTDRGDLKMHCSGNLQASGTANKVTTLSDGGGHVSGSRHCLQARCVRLAVGTLALNSRTMRPLAALIEALSSGHSAI